MAVHAHPDDESNSTGGTLARYAAEGVRTVLVTCTNGEFGDAPGHIKPGEDGHDPDDVARIRLRRVEGRRPTRSTSRTWRRSATATRVCTDGRRTSIPTRSTRSPTTWSCRALVALIERFRPQVVVTYFANSGYNHPDHLKAHDDHAHGDRRSAGSRASCTSSRARVRTASGCARSPSSTASRCRSCPQPPPPDPDASDPSNHRGRSASTTRSSRRRSTRRRTPTAERAALGAHLSQLEGSFFLRFPDEAFPQVFGTETFIRDARHHGRAAPRRRPLRRPALTPSTRTRRRSPRAGRITAPVSRRCRAGAHRGRCASRRLRCRVPRS